jgi:hypothetical protein
MAGTILGKDQIEKVNVLYGRLYAHIKAILTTKATPFEKIKMYLAMECLDTTEMAAIFSLLPFISPAEKRAMVRAAIDDVRLGTEIEVVDAPLTDNAGVVKVAAPEVAKAYTPAPFKLNVATTTDHKVV